MICRDVLSLCDGYNCAFGDDYAYCCMLEAGHEGPHWNEFEHEGKSVVITWDAGEGSILVTDDEYLLLAREAEAPVPGVVRK